MDPAVGHRVSALEASNSQDSTTALYWMWVGKKGTREGNETARKVFSHAIASENHPGTLGKPEAFTCQGLIGA